MLEILEERAQPSAAPISLGTAAQFAVFGLQGTCIDNENATVTGDVGVSRFGGLDNANHSTITGNVDEYSLHQTGGRGRLTGKVLTNAAALTQADKDAMTASSAAAALAPTQTLRNVERATTVNGSGGLNVIDVRGDISASLVLNGTSHDVFIVNVHGDLNLHGKSVLGLAGGVTSNHVIYNFVGRDGTLRANSGNVINGTILAPSRSVDLDGTVVNGEVISGGRFISLSDGAKVNHVAFTGADTSASATISGAIFVDYNSNGVQDSGDNGFSGLTVTLTGVDNLGNSVTKTMVTDSNGDYSFTGLRAGTYSLSFTHPSGTGTAVVGQVGGATDGSLQDNATIAGIVLSANSVGTNYGFAVVANAS